MKEVRIQQNRLELCEVESVRMGLGSLGAGFRLPAVNDRKIR